MTDQEPRRPLRVMVVVKTAHGGLWIVPQLEELRRRGHQVSVLLPGRAGRLSTELNRRGIPTVPATCSFRFRPGLDLLRDMWRLRRQLQQLRPDVVQYHLYASALAVRLATIGLRLPRVHMVAGPLYLESPIFRQIERVLSRLDSLIIGSSDHATNQYRQLGCDESRLATIPYGVNTAEFRPPSPRGRADARAALGLGPDTFLVVMVAYVYAPKRAVHHGHGIKGHDILLTAWREFAANHPAARLLLVGGGFDRRGEAYRRHLINQHGAADDPTINWITTVSDVRPYYAAADVSVSPSRAESHGTTLEASAMAVPSIASNAGALPESVDDHTGWVVPRDDVPSLLQALERAHEEFKNRTLAARGRRARDQAVDRFDQLTAASRVANVIEAVARRPPDHQ